MALDYQREDILSAPQGITGSFVDLGRSINVLRWGKVSLFISVVVNNSTAIQIKPLLRDYGDSQWFDVPIKQGLTVKTEIRQGVYELSYSVDFSSCFDIDVSGAGEFKIQVKGAGNSPVPGIVTKCFMQLTPGWE